MTNQQIAVHMEAGGENGIIEVSLPDSSPPRTLTPFYLVFAFTAALLEGLPIIGLVFTVRIGAAMWAYGILPLWSCDALKIYRHPQIQRNDSTLWQRNICMVGY
jgi:hypothetical protein